MQDETHEVAHRRASSNSTVRARIASTLTVATSLKKDKPVLASKSVNLWIHDEAFSHKDVLISQTVLEDLSVEEDTLLEVVASEESSNAKDYPSADRGQGPARLGTEDAEYRLSNFLCLPKLVSPELVSKQPSLELSIINSIASPFGLRPRTRVRLNVVSREQYTASHIELGFRDAYLARSDMWRFVSQELIGKTVFVGQKISFAGSLRLNVKAVHLHGHRVRTAYVASTTVPIFRSEAARYVLFIQMSREMWDFDSEGSGEILFNRVINGFLPDLFQRWTELEVKHLVSIVLFSRLEYDRYDLTMRTGPSGLTDALTKSSSSSSLQLWQYEDFYRVVVTDMASAQWGTILNELKKDFKVFLRDLSLHEPRTEGGDAFEVAKTPRMISSKPIIAGRPSSAVKGNILEAINIASTQFAHDYLDRDLIRTGISVVVITAGTGVFEVDRDLLNLTSENLTNNGIGIDVVCLSKMPLHSVPLFKYRKPLRDKEVILQESNPISSSPLKKRLDIVTQSLSRSPALSVAASSLASTASTNGLVSRFSHSLATDNLEQWSYGIPQWIDLSYWAPESHDVHRIARKSLKPDQKNAMNIRKDPFVPRVRMYEVQMMGIMELGMADISVPLLSETQDRTSKGSSTKEYSFRSLSVSPAASRKGPRTGLNGNHQVHGPRPAHEMTAASMFAQMDEYDGELFTDRKKKRQSHNRRKHRRSELPGLHSSASVQASISDGSGSKPVTITSNSAKTITGSSSSAGGSTPTPTPKRDAESSKTARNFTYALRGLAPLVRASAQPEITSENIQAQPVRQRPASAKRTLTSSNLTTKSNASIIATDDMKADTVAPSSAVAPAKTSSSSETPSKPMKISQNKKKNTDSTSSWVSRDVSKIGSPSPNRTHSTIGDTQSSGSESEAVSEGELVDHQYPLRYLDESSSHGKIPFVRDVNPSNPLKRHAQEESLYGRWQHLYPRKPKAATVKWRSLCTPASVPLTTADFPTREALEKNFETSSYTITPKPNSSMSETQTNTPTVFQDMLNLRIAHGYQMLVGSRVEDATTPNVGSPSVFFDLSNLGQTGQVVYLSMGNTIQRLSCIEHGAIAVTRYWRTTAEVQPAYAKVIEYKPRIRTILAHDYLPRDMELKGFREHFPWQLADQYLMDPMTDLKDAVELLHFWRARFVLLPVEPPSTSKKSHNAQNDETDEEIHLLGIRALTQMWQKHRHIPNDEPKRNLNRNSIYNRKDPNPLDVEFRTMNPSEVVATELDRLLAGPEAIEAPPTQLFPESELFDRFETSFAAVVQAMQSDKGIEIKNRRWHFRLYLNCFKGEDLTSWLLHKFKNIDTREEAVDYGDQLMEAGFFEHVNKRHKFKDGHYFYSIHPSHLIQKTEPRSSWFSGGRRSEKSIPPTPMPQLSTLQSPVLSTRARSSSKSHTENISSSTEFAGSGLEKKKISIWLSKMIKIDVDPRRRSNRPEVVNLHYDRIHNPENCYHIEISWLNVTSKLVDDAVVAWATQAEKYGLKLVEVPITEACNVMQNEPFRAPYRIRPGLEPPRKPVNGNTYFTATSFTAQPSLMSEKNLYLKALLKRFNFVLDLEAASEFPDTVDAQYSWGKLHYRYTQFVHRSGVILAQITDDGDILLLANRLYNSRSTFSKETLKHDPKKDLPYGARTPALPVLQASGIIGLNVQSPSIGPSPMVKASADVLGPALPSSSIAAYVTPEQIKNDLEAFCHDKNKLEAFYKEVPNLPTPVTRKSASTSSSVLRPIVRDLDQVIPDLKLPERLVDAASTAISSPDSAESSVLKDLPGRRTLAGLDKI